MKVLSGIVLAFSSFSKIPMPQIEWREDNMRYMMCFFPLIGLAIGLALALWFWLADVLAFGPVLFGVGVALVPILVSGGIHMDGFCDVVDAQSSHAEPERKREILKDPHSGAFAAIAVAAYLVVYSGVASELVIDWHIAVVLAGMHATSRCLSGIATVAFPLSNSKGMLSMFHESSHGRIVFCVLVVELVAVALCMGLAYAPSLAMVGVGIICLAAVFAFARSQFGGMSGDIAGFFLQVAELAMLCALVVALKLVAL